MKNKSLFTILPVILFTASCGLKEQVKINMAQVAQIEDSMLKGQIIPKTVSVHILQDEDYSKANFIIGNKALYSSKDSNKMQKAAIRTGLMLARVLGPEMSLSKGTFIISCNDHDDNKIPADGMSFDMKIDSLKKVIFPPKG